jgi:hypothetical protein
METGTEMERYNRLTKCAVSTSIWNCVFAAVLRSVWSFCEYHSSVSPPRYVWSLRRSNVMICIWEEIAPKPV